MIFDALQNLTISSLFFLLTAFFSSLILFYIRPLFRLARGPVRHPNFFLHTVSLGFYSFSEIHSEKTGDRIWSIFNFAFGFVLLALIPITGSFQVYFERPDIIFVFLYLVNRVVFSAPLDKGAGLAKTIFDTPLLTATILIFLFCIFGLKKGGGAHISEPVFHGVVFSSVSSVIAFFLLFGYSSLFFIPSTVSLGGVHLASASRFMSKSVWFALLIWIFFGTIPNSAWWSFTFYVFFTSLLIVIYEILKSFFPRLSAHINFEIVKRSLMPALLLVLLVSWVEEKLIW